MFHIFVKRGFFFAKYLMDEEIANIVEKYPFLSYGKMLGEEYLGIIQNSDNQMLSMYCLRLVLYLSQFRTQQSQTQATGSVFR